MRVALPRDRRDVLRQVGSAAVLMATRPLWAQGPAARSAPIVAAASDLKFALDEVVAAFSAQTGQPIRVVYGSSGLLAMQIRQGAPFELFLSADEAVAALRAKKRSIAALTYGWTTPDDPDVTAAYLAAVRRFLRSPLGAHVTAVFWE